MTTSALLMSVLAHKADLNEYTKMQIYYANKHDTLSGQVSKYASWDQKWNEAYDEALNPTKKIKFQGVEYGTDANPEGMTPELAKLYAYSKAPHYDETRYEILVEEDTEMEALNELYATLIEETKATVQAEEEKLAEYAKDTNMLGGS